VGACGRKENPSELQVQPATQDHAGSLRLPREAQRQQRRENPALDWAVERLREKRTTMSLLYPDTDLIDRAVRTDRDVLVAPDDGRKPKARAR
jgi:hypothetical protein